MQVNIAKRQIFSVVFCHENKIVGYLLSGDPTYITSHNNARSLIMKVERDELVEEVLKTYIENNWN